METAEGVIDATKLLEERSDEKKFIEEGGLSFDLHYLHAINPSPFNDTSDSKLVPFPNLSTTSISSIYEA